MFHIQGGANLPMYTNSIGYANLFAGLGITTRQSGDRLRPGLQGSISYVRHDISSVVDGREYYGVCQFVHLAPSLTLCRFRPRRFSYLAGIGPSVTVFVGPYNLGWLAAHINMSAGYSGVLLQAEYIRGFNEARMMNVGIIVIPAAMDSRKHRPRTGNKAPAAAE